MNSAKPFEFCGKLIGEGHPPFIIAEIGFNHRGDVNLCKRMIEAAALNGADAVKLQTFVGEELYSKKFMANDPENPGSEIPLYEFFKRFELTRSDYAELFQYAAELNIPLFSTPFDEASLDMLVELGMPAIKIASPDLTHLPLLKRVAEKALPVVLSTGMGEEKEIDRALEILGSKGNDRIVLLHCVSNYPSKYEEMNLLCLQSLRSQFDVLVGLSDHTLDNLSGVVATALGAVMIEKHFTLDRTVPGADNAISMQPSDLHALKTATLDVCKILGGDKKTIQPSEEPARQSARRSLVARVDIEPGTVLTEEMLAIKRPGTGIPPEELAQVLGRKVKSKIFAEELIDWSMI